MLYKKKTKVLEVCESWFNLRGVEEWERLLIVVGRGLEEGDRENLRLLIRSKAGFIKDFGLRLEKIKSKLNLMFFCLLVAWCGVGLIFFFQEAYLSSFKQIAFILWSGWNAYLYFLIEALRGGVIKQHECFTGIIAFGGDIFADDNSDD